MITSRRTTRRPLLAGATALLLARVLHPRVADAATYGAAEDVVARLVGRVADALAEPGMDDAAVTTRLAAAVGQETDLALLARLALGRHWRTADPAQRARYEALFQAYMLRTFARRLHHYAGTDPAEVRRRFVILGSAPVGGRDVVVHSRLAPPDGPPLRVDWRLREDNGRLAIIDLIVEGVSLLVTQRAEFATVVERKGLGGLIDELHVRLARPA